ncbi:MAG: modification methylase [Parvibaculum sp.]|nr:modification methylase [Parvibaculum sp.]
MYSILYCDPPWDYKGQSQTGKNSVNTGGAVAHYATMKLADLKTFTLPALEKDCLLFMWSSSPHLNQAIQLGEAWGFKYITIGFVWDKEMVNPSYYTMSQVEICLIFKKGRIPQPRGKRNIRQMVSEKRGRHSAKPAQVRDRINEMFPTQRKMEMFARERTEGWDVLGNEV